LAVDASLLTSIPAEFKLARLRGDKMLAIAHPLPEGWLGGRLERGGRGGRRFPSTQVGSQPRRHVVRAAGRFKSSVLVWRACGGERWAGSRSSTAKLSYP
jgi:hypothetical protein